MKKVILIPDSFKGTMSSIEICSIMKEQIKKHYPKCDVLSIAVADGGEGSVEAFLSSLGGEKIYKEVTGPYWGEKVKAYYGILPNNTAVIEMAQASGLPLVGERKDPSKTTTYGVGELILDALEKGSKRIILGLGGSATNDASCGLASALGVKFFDLDGNSFIPTGENLDRIERIDLSYIDARVKKTPIVTMCDIDNPFYGPDGASYVYGPQKGATPSMVEDLDKKMRKLASLIKRDFNIDLQKIPGSGAAGGMGGGMVAFFSSKLQMGIETVLETVKFNSLLSNADYVFTGEGRLDSQSLRGKVVIGVARKAKEKNVPVVAIVGDIADNIESVYREGVSAVFSINRVALPYSEQKRRAKSDLALTMDNLMRYQKMLEKE